MVNYFWPMNRARAAKISPMPIWKALLFFGIPALFTNLLFWKVLPLIDFFGPRLFFSFLIGFGLNGSFLLVLALYFYSSEGNPWSWNQFAERFRLRSLDAKSWIWIVVLVVVLSVSQLPLMHSSAWIQEHLIGPPKFWARIVEPDSQYFMEMSLDHRVKLIVAYFLLQVFFAFASELWWRGYILPRQEIRHGKTAWAVHGLLWNLYEGFMFWQVLMILPGAMLLSYVAQKQQNTWVGLIARAVTGFPSFVFLTFRLLTS